MALDYAATINALYLAYFGRAADPAGLAYWEQKLAFFNGDPTQIIVSFQASTEAQTRFAQVSVTDQITAIYKTLFNRAPDQEGLAYWAGRVNAGESIGKVSLAIYNAAIGTDGQIAALRAKASSDFSNSLNALAIDYFSEDAVTVSRAVIAAIRPGASNSDITDAVNTATGLAMSATSNPGLLSSLNGGKSIVELFDTARGSADPLGLLEALTAIFDIAASNPSSLSSLLGNGDFAQLLSAMPQSATFQDLINAAQSGSMQNVIDVVYPPPPPTISLSFTSVTSGTLDADPSDAVTNLASVTANFQVSGSLNAGETLQYRINGGSWIDLSQVTNAISISGIGLGQGTPTQGGLTTEIELRVLNSGGSTRYTTSQSILYDNTAPGATLSFVRIGNGAEGVLSTTSSTADVVFDASSVAQGDRVQWRFSTDTNWNSVTSIGGDGRFTLASVDLLAADRTIQMRVVDAAGNTSSTQQWTIDGPFAASVTSINFELTDYRGIIHFNTDIGEIISLEGEPHGLVLADMVTGSAQPTSIDYLNGPSFGLIGAGDLSLAAGPELGLYYLSWSDNTFRSAEGNVRAGAVTFAGGTQDVLSVEGFAVESILPLTSDSDSADNTKLNTAYVFNNTSIASVFTGGGNDVIVDNGGVLHIGYRTVVGDYDLIIGFDQHSDTIDFWGAAAAMFDRDASQDLTWDSSNTHAMPAVATSQTEALSAVTDQSMLVSSSSYDQYLLGLTLNSMFDISALPHKNVLLYLRSTSLTEGLLMKFNDANGDGVIDMDEVTYIAAFTGGAPVHSDFYLIVT